MLRIIREQGSGKTKELMTYAKENTCMIVCKNPSGLRLKGLEYDLRDIDYVDYEEFLNRSWAYADRDVLVDDLDGFVKAFGNIKGYTLGI